MTWDIGVKAYPTAGLAATAYNNNGDIELRVYYQGERRLFQHVIRLLKHSAEDASLNLEELRCVDSKWSHGKLDCSLALPGMRLAAVTYGINGGSQTHVFYQAINLEIQDQIFDKKEGWRRGKFTCGYYLTRLIVIEIYTGSFNPGKGAGRTPLSAVSFSSPSVQVYWREHSQGQIYSAKLSAGAWSGPKTIKCSVVGYEFSVLEWDTGKRLRLYGQDLKGRLFEHHSDDNGENWSEGSGDS